MKNKSFIWMLGVAAFVIGLLLRIAQVDLTVSSIPLLGGALLILAYLAIDYKTVLSGLGQRSTQYGTIQAVLVVIVIGILCFILAYSHTHSKRFDLTQNKRFTLDHQTIGILQNLQEDVTIYCFPEPMGGPFWKNQMSDMLNQYRHYSDKIKYEFIDYMKEHGKAQEFRNELYSVPAIIVKCGANLERARSEKEEDIANAIIKVTHTEEKSLYFLTGHGERDINSETDAFGMGIIKRLLEDKRYTVKELEMARQHGIPEDCAVLVIAGPQTDLFDHELNAIERYLNLGGNVIAMLEPETAPNLVSWFGKFGLNVGNDMICEAEVQADLASLLQGKLTGRLSVSTVPTISKRDYGSHEITRDFDLSTQYPSSRSVSVASVLPGGLSVDKILETKGELENSPDPSIPGSWAETDLEMLKQQQAQFDESEDLKGPVTLAALVTIDRHQYEPAKAAEAAIQSATGVQRPDKSYLLVFGDSDFASNAGIRFDRGVLFTNCINYLIGAKHLITVPPKMTADTSLTLSKGEMRLIQVVVLGIWPLVVIAIGIGVGIRRRRSA